MTHLTDNDKNYGPITFAKSSWNRWSAVLSSGDNYDGKNMNDLTVYAFGYIVRIMLPEIIKPFSQKVKAIGWDEATIERMGRNYYFNYFEREYGFSLSDGNYFQLYYGIQSGFGNLPEYTKEQRWSNFLPWTEWECVRSSCYRPDGTHFASEDRNSKSRCDAFFEYCKRVKDCPNVQFNFQDYDGEEIIATCLIKEREWHLGEGLFKWLRFFTKPRIHRDLDLTFSKEVGPQKRSWKGGTIGHSIQMVSNETPEQAFIRYCDMDHERKGRSFKLKYIGPVI